MRTRFSFPYESLLTLRLARERASQQAVAAVERERVALEDALRALQNRMNEVRETQRASVSGMVDLVAMRTHAAVSMDVERQANQIVLKLAGTHRRLQSARDELNGAMRDRRALEILRERRHDAWKADMNRSEIDEIDELAVNRAAGRHDSC